MSKRILFQGDSITDCDRDRQDFYGMGNGYPALVKAELSEKYPDEFEYINKGVSGSRVLGTYLRMDQDITFLNPDYMSLFIGVNDAWRAIDSRCITRENDFEKHCRMLLDDVTETCPNLKIMFMTPFLLYGDHSCNTEDYPNRFEVFKKATLKNADVIKKLAKEYGFPCIDLQKAFDEVCEKEDQSLFTKDGVHPTKRGHEIIKKLWLETFEQIK